MTRLILTKHLFLSVLTVITLAAHGQDTLTSDEFINWVSKHHPLTLQADLKRNMGRESIKAARGGFDPVFYGQHRGKEFGEVNYFQKQEMGLLLPTFGGVELDARYERNAGSYLNPEVTNTAGLWSAGVRFNLGRGLMIDERRAALRKAQMFKNETEEQRLIILNELYVQAMNAYWKWARAYADYKVYQRAYELAVERFEGIKINFIQGDVPAIDTVEAYTQVQAREVSMIQAENELYTARQTASAYAWDEGVRPIDIRDDVVPQPLNRTENPDPAPEEELLNALEQHPLLKAQDYRIEQLKVERRLRAEFLKPKVYIQYNYLTEDVGTVPDNALFTNNYILGAGFSTPLFLRRERGELNITEARIRDRFYGRSDSYAMLKAELNNALNTYKTKLEQLVIFKSNVLNLQRLVEAERTKFNIGESSLFLINAREISYIDAQTVLNNLRSSLRITDAELKNAAGNAWREFEGEAEQ